MTTEPMSVEMRKELGDVLSRAHYQNERIIIAKRDKPFAFVGSMKAEEQLENFDLLSDQMGLDPSELMDRLLKLTADEEKKAALREMCST